MSKCSKYIVEGKFDKIILNRIGITDVANGKENVKRLFRSAKEGCFLVDGNDQGFNSIATEFNGDKDPPIISIENKKLIIIGDSKNDYRGGIESLMLQQIKIDNQEENAIENLLKIVNLGITQEAKVRLIMIVFLKTSDYEVFFSVDRFASTVIDLISTENIKKIFQDLKII